MKSAKKNKELRRRRPPVGFMPVSSARPHKIAKYLGGGGINPLWTRLQELKEASNGSLSNV